MVDGFPLMACHKCGKFEPNAETICPMASLSDGIDVAELGSGLESSSLTFVQSQTRYNPQSIFHRYSRQMLLEQVGRNGQYSLLSSRILVVGAGGLAATVLPYLAGAGIGFIRIVDNDTVDESNLHRQVLFRTPDIGQFKALCAQRTIQQLNPSVVVEAHCERFSYTNGERLSEGIDIVVDCTDNMDARYCMSDVCVVRGLFLVTGSAIGIEGQVAILCGHDGKSTNTDEVESECSTYNAHHPGRAPCYRCLHPTPSRVEGCRSCSASGVLGPIPGLIGCHEALETIKLCIALNHHQTNNPTTNVQMKTEKQSGVVSLAPRQPLQNLIGRQLYFDGVLNEWEAFDISQRRNPTCAVCGQGQGVVTLADCHDLYLSQKETSVPMPGAPVPLPVAGVAVSTYHQLLSTAHHLLVDVRVTKQFNLLSFLHYFQSEYDHCLASTRSSTTKTLFPERSFVLRTFPLTCSGFKFCYTVYHLYWNNNDSNEASSMYMVNIPLADMQLPPNAKPAVRARVEALFDCITAVRTGTYKCNDDVLPPNNDNTAAMPIYVLCRRGVDSVTATRCLTAACGPVCAGGEARVYNVDGGLQAWRAKVDTSLPEY